MKFRRTKARTETSSFKAHGELGLQRGAHACHPNTGEAGGGHQEGPHKPRLACLTSGPSVSPSSEVSKKKGLTLGFGENQDPKARTPQGCADPMAQRVRALQGRLDNLSGDPQD